jgi:hypothetical protein
MGYERDRLPLSRSWCFQYWNWRYQCIDLSSLRLWYVEEPTLCRNNQRRWRSSRSRQRCYVPIDWEVNSIVEIPGRLNILAESPQSTQLSISESLDHDSNVTDKRDLHSARVVFSTRASRGDFVGRIDTFNGHCPTNTVTFSMCATNENELLLFNGLVSKWDFQWETNTFWKRGR